MCGIKNKRLAGHVLYPERNENWTAAMISALSLSALLYVCGYLTGLLAFFWMAKRRKLATTGVMQIAVVGLLGGLLGANIGQWLVAGSAGKSVLGAIVGGYLSVFLYKRAVGLRRPTGDLFAVALCAGEAVGRWGCFFGGCCYGKPTTAAWAVWQHDAFRHPTQIYLSLASLAVLAVLLWFEFHSLPENGIFYLQGTLYCLARFCIEFFRDVPTAWGGLTAAQWACIAGILYFGGSFFRLMRSQETHYEPLSQL